MSLPTRPIPFRWMGDGFAPLNDHWAREADKYFVVGEVYPIEVHEDRSTASHHHYFAAVNEAWQNLPEAMSTRFPTPEHLRKYALIQCGYRAERSVVCANHAAAKRMAAFITPLDDFAFVAASGNLVTVWTAKSQSYRSMGKKDFAESKDAVLGYVANLIGSTPAMLSKNVEAAA